MYQKPKLVIKKNNFAHFYSRGNRYFDALDQQLFDMFDVSVYAQSGGGSGAASQWDR